jgi:hypothetical protein
MQGVFLTLNLSVATMQGVESYYKKNLPMHSAAHVGSGLRTPRQHARCLGTRNCCYGVRAVLSWRLPHWFGGCRRPRLSKHQAGRVAPRVTFSPRNRRSFCGSRASVSDLLAWWSDGISIYEPESSLRPRRSRPGSIRGFFNSCLYKSVHDECVIWGSTYVCCQLNTDLTKPAARRYGVDVSSWVGQQGE